MKLRLTKNKEWGSKARKEQEAIRGLTNQDRRRDVHERVQDELEVIADRAQAEFNEGLDAWYEHCMVRMDDWLPEHEEDDE